jgi:ppGpp synthetase/RelA/SpoT-type nucleotidyltranferase
MSIALLTEDEFLYQNRISQQQWQASQITWATLKAIGLCHEKRTEALNVTAESYARIIQQCSHVHSVRWRVKKPQHLMEKIVRKTLPHSATFKAKYLGINQYNYDAIVTDLIGVRALHLFKDDGLAIHDYLMSKWQYEEPPVYYVRNGDDDVSAELPADIQVKIHPAGYRSLHYVFGSELQQRPIFTEVQVRTIFEEAWTEIDHKIRYPNFSTDAEICSFLLIFNRLVGSADEMGSFVRQLAVEATQRQQTLMALSNGTETNASDVETLFQRLEEQSEKQHNSQLVIDQLRLQVMQLQTDKKALQQSINANILTSVATVSQRCCKASELLDK